MKGFWNGNGGVPGDYVYGTIHIISAVIVAAITIAFTIIGLKQGERQKRKTIVALALTALVFEGFWRLVYFLAEVDPHIKLYPFYPCNLAGIIVPIIALTKSRVLKEIFYAFAFVGGVITFAMPQGIFNNAVINFPIIKSVIQHLFIIVIPVYEYFNKTFILKFKNFYLMIIGMFIHLFNSEFVPRFMGLTDTDYIFLNSGLPFVIPGVPGWITLPVFGILVMILFYALLDIKGFKQFIRPKKKRA